VLVPRLLRPRGGPGLLHLGRRIRLLLVLLLNSLLLLSLALLLLLLCLLGLLPSLLCLLLLRFLRAKPLHRGRRLRTDLDVELSRCALPAVDRPMSRRAGRLPLALVFCGLGRPGPALQLGNSRASRRRAPRGVLVPRLLRPRGGPGLLHLGRRIRLLLVLLLNSLLLLSLALLLLLLCLLGLLPSLLCLLLLRFLRAKPLHRGRRLRTDLDVELSRCALPAVDRPMSRRTGRLPLALVFCGL